MGSDESGLEHDVTRGPHLQNINFELEARPTESSKDCWYYNLYYPAKKP